MVLQKGGLCKYLSRNSNRLFPLSIPKQGLEVIESTNLKYFTKEMTAEFYALKGMFLAQINKYANCVDRVAGSLALP